MNGIIAATLVSFMIAAPPPYDGEIAVNPGHVAMVKRVACPSKTIHKECVRIRLGDGYQEDVVSTLDDALDRLSGTEAAEQAAPQSSTLPR